MKYFTQDYLDFFKELAANNNRDWFQANKKRYDVSVKDPFTAFTTEMISRAAKIESNFDIDPKQSVFRIYRDIRFSKDKTPYKMHMSAIISPGGRKEGMGIPGMYLQLGAEDIRFYSGLYMPQKEILYRVREYIAKHSRQLDKLVSDPEFIEKFGALQGDRNKVIPKEFKQAAEKQPFIYNKQFYFFASLPARTVLKNDLCDILMGHFRASEPLRKYFTKARGL